MRGMHDVRLSRALCDRNFGGGFDEKFQNMILVSSLKSASASDSACNKSRQGRDDDERFSFRVRGVPVRRILYAALQ